MIIRGASCHHVPTESDTLHEWIASTVVVGKTFACFTRTHVAHALSQIPGIVDIHNLAPGVAHDGCIDRGNASRSDTMGTWLFIYIWLPVENIRWRVVSLVFWFPILRINQLNYCRTYLHVPKSRTSGVLLLRWAGSPVSSMFRKSANSTMRYAV